MVPMLEAWFYPWSGNWIPDATTNSSNTAAKELESMQSNKLIKANHKNNK